MNLNDLSHWSIIEAKKSRLTINTQKPYLSTV